MPSASCQQEYCVSGWFSGIGGEHRLWTNANAAILAEKTHDSSAGIAVFMQIGRF
jgi:hypothetical protein